MTARPLLEVLEPGLLTTVQDAGRHGRAAEGLGPGGAADPWSLAVANLLVGEPPDEPVLEVTLAGPTLRALEPLVVGLAGADLGARVAGAAAAPGRSFALRSGDTIEFAGRRRGGCRAYVSVAGGLAVPRVLGSAATALGPGFGGIDGRPLRTGDVLRGRTPARRTARAAVVPADRLAPPGTAPGVVRVVRGPHADELGEDALRALCATRWTVDAASDRTGLRLAGGSLGGASTGDLPSIGVLVGTVQVPPDGRPIVLLADHQPTGGYPVLAVAAAPDVAVLAQVAPGDRLRFVEITLAEASEARHRAREALRTLARTLDEARAWDELWAWAGG